MYKYLCVISDSADENAFRDTIEKIKGYYPHFEYAEQMVNGSLEKVITVPDEKGDPSSICIRIDYQNSRTVVISEAYLHYIFSGRTVENISKYKGLPIELLLSGAFLAANIYIIKQISNLFWILLFAPIGFLIYIMPLMLLHTVSAWGIKKGMGLPISKILFMELGGYFLVPFYAVLIIRAVIENSLESIPIAMLGVRYIVFLLPIAAISVSIADKISKK